MNRAQEILRLMSDPFQTSARGSDCGLDEVHARLAMEAAGLGLWEWSLKPDEVRINDTLAHILGRPDLGREPFPAEELVKLTHPDDRDKVTSALQSCIRESDGAFFVEHRALRPDGQERWLWIRASAVQRDANGHVLKIVGVVQDHTEAKRAELALEREKLRNDLALSGSLIAIWEWDIHSNQVHWSSYLSEILGLPKNLSSGERDFLNSRVHPDDQAAARKATDDHIEQGRPYDVEFRMRHEAGHYITVRSRGQAVRDEKGQILRIAGSLTDITRERESEGKLRRVGLRSRLALEAAQLATWELDLLAGTAIMDARLCDLLGRPDLVDKPIAGDSMLEFTAPEDRDLVRGLFTELIKGRSEFVHNEHYVVRSDGERVPIFAHVGVAERSAEGRSIRLVGVTQDLSEQKQTERVLREAKERAEAASQAKSTFLATMSHEIRTPLNGILGVSQLLTLSELDDRQRRLVDTLQSTGSVLSSVIEDILDISRIEAGKLNLTPETVDVTAWLTDTLAPFQTLASQGGLDLNLETAFGPDTVRLFDAKRTSQIVGNFVSNAIKFTEAGQVSVRVSLPADEWLRVEVKDTGPGIAESLQANIFDRFTQGDMSPSRVHGGSGLGLAIAKELTELAGGRIGVASTLCDGSTFWFEIPALRAGSEHTRVEAPAQPQAVRDLRALIVEDNAINRETLTEMLEQHAIACEAVGNGEQALERLRAEHFDLVLLDLHMPGMGGLEVLKTLRTQAGYPNAVPVIVVSADATPQARQSATEFGAQFFQTKPVDMAVLLSAIDSLFAEQEAS